MEGHTIKMGHAVYIKKHAINKSGRIVRNIMQRGTNYSAAKCYKIRRVSACVNGKEKERGREIGKRGVYIYLLSSRYRQIPSALFVIFCSCFFPCVKQTWFCVTYMLYFEFFS